MNADPRVAPLVPRWQWSRLPELAPAALYAALAARQQAFAVEQNCAYLDADGLDFDAWHLLGWAGDAPAPQLVACLRVIDPGRKFAEPTIGRVVTVRAHRGRGLGRVLMAEGVARTRAAWPGWAIRLAAQQRLQAFYASLGFESVAAPYLEDGIPHVDMVLAPAP